MKQDTEQLRQLAYDYLKDGRLEYERGNTDDSITLTEKAKNTFETIGDKEGCASSLNMLAVLLGATGNGSMAIDQLFQCIEIAQKYGYPIYEMDLIQEGEEFYASMRRSTNGGGENSPMLEGEDDFYELFFASIAFENPGLDR